MAFRFLTFELDIARRELLCDGTPIAISPKALDVLYYLMANHDRLVSKSELMDRFWSARASEAALQKTISQVRKAVGGGTSDASVIKTYHGRGFRFVAALVEVDESSASSASASAKEAAPLALREKRLATVLCARLYAPGTTAPRDDAREAAVARFLARAQLTVDQYQGAFLHTLIDGFTAAFGLDPHNEDGARRAVHCAMALAASDAAEADVNWSFGIESGALAALDGTGNGRLSLPGDIERGAAELAGMSPSGEIVVSATVRDQMRDEIEVANIQNGFRVLSVAPMTAGIPARPRKRPTRFIGRTAEMTFLATQRDMLQDGTGQAMLLSGPAGIGKTRLVSEFLGSIDEAAFRPVKVQCLPTLCNTPLAPIRALCLALFSTPPGGVIRDDTDAALLRELRDDTAGDAPELQLLSDHQRRQRSCALFDRIVNGLGTPRPLVVVFEDVHWLDSTSREYLEALLRQVDRKRLMVVMTTRPSDMPPLTETVLHLSPLNRNESLSLLRDSCDETGIPAEVATTLVERAEGNPFFIEELALAAQTGADPAVDLPTTVHSVIASRIGALAPGLRQLVYLISVIGPPAPLSLIALLLERPADTVERDMLDLVRRGFLQADPAGYGFRHMLINDTAYAMVEESDRRRLHAEIAQYLEDDDRGTTARPERLAWHHQEAGATDQAIQYWIAASRAALHRSARNEAITFAENGLALIDGETREDTRRELDLLLCLAPALIALRGFGAEAVGQAYTQADRLNRRVGNPKSEIRVRVGLWIHTWVRGRLTESLQHADELLELAAQFPDPA
ncbi:MAG: AAA family ATPase, partial [Gammaproteobacteria bacterium]|nr:AAA family ATPase [Gammaproteobacteria bacterium]